MFLMTGTIIRSGSCSLVGMMIHGWRWCTHYLLIPRLFAWPGSGFHKHKQCQDGRPRVPPGRWRAWGKIISKYFGVFPFHDSLNYSIYANSSNLIITNPYHYKPNVNWKVNKCMKNWLRRFDQRKAPVRVLVVRRYEWKMKTITWSTHAWKIITRRTAEKSRLRWSCTSVHILLMHRQEN